MRRGGRRREGWREEEEGEDSGERGGEGGDSGERGGGRPWREEIPVREGKGKGGRRNWNRRKVCGGEGSGVNGWGGGLGRWEQRCTFVQIYNYVALCWVSEGSLSPTPSSANSDMAAHLLVCTGDSLDTRMDECCRILHTSGENPDMRR